MDNKIAKEVGIVQEEESNISKGKVLRSGKEIMDENNLDIKPVDDNSVEKGIGEANTMETEIDIVVEKQNKKGDVAQSDMEAGKKVVMAKVVNQQPMMLNDQFQILLSQLQNMQQNMVTREEAEKKEAIERKERITEKEEREKREELERNERIAENEERRFKEALDREKRKAEKEERKQIIAQLQNMQQDMITKEEERDKREEAEKREKEERRIEKKIRHLRRRKEKKGKRRGIES